MLTSVSMKFLAWAKIQAIRASNSAYFLNESADIEAKNFTNECFRFFLKESKAF